MKFFVSTLLMLFTLSAFAYVPTFESLFRNGNNPDVSSNALVLTGKITSLNMYAAKKEEAAGETWWVKWVYHMGRQGELKVTQLLYNSPKFDDASLVHKVYMSNLNAKGFQHTPEQIEKGLWLSMLNSLLINDGSFMVDFLRHQNVDVKANEQILDTEKRELIGRYKTWLSKTNGGKNPGAEENPMSPSGASDREHAVELTKRPLYQDQGIITLDRYQGEPAWHVVRDSFEAWVQDKEREIRYLSFKHDQLAMEFQNKDFFKIDGLHGFPRFSIVKNSIDQHFQVEFLTLKYFGESTEEMLARLKKNDQAVKAQGPSHRPSFLL